MKTGVLVLPAARSRVLDFVALAKPRLNFLVVLTTGVGYYLAVGAVGSPDYLVFFHTVLGTALVAGGASALNQLYERDLDGRMPRTAMRPLPEGRVQPAEARRYGWILSIAGLAQLAIGAGILAAAVALVTLGSYIAVYTPLKRRTPLSTAVGAIPGALPPLIGWAAARGSLEPAAWTLFAIVFLWQMPHFFSIAWIYRTEYERAGIPLLPVVEPEGRSTARQVLLYTIALLTVSSLPSFVGLAGNLYLGSALVLGLVFVGLAVRFAHQRSLSSARWLFFGSVTYLPLLWGVLVVDHTLGLGG